MVKTGRHKKYPKWGGNILTAWSIKVASIIELLAQLVTWIISWHSRYVICLTFTCSPRVSDVPSTVPVIPSLMSLMLSGDRSPDPDLPPLPGIISPPSDSLCPNPRISTQMSFSPKVVTFWALHWWRALTKCLVIKSGSLNHHWLTLSTMFLCLQFHDHWHGAGAAMERISNELRSSWSSTSRENKNIRVRFPWAVWSASTSVKKMSNKLKIKMNLRWETLIHWKLYQGLNHEHMC